MIAEWFDTLTPLAASILIGSSFLGSLLTAALGVGGGAFLITVMADIVPAIALIPLHGIVQLGSNGSRMVLTRKHIQSSVVGWFALGALLASVCAVFLLGQIDAEYIPPLVALFILWLSWGPMPKIDMGKQTFRLILGGWLTTLATMIVGATGPLVSAWLGRAGTTRWTYTANFSSCMSLQHLLKIIVFGYAGFAFSDWIPLLVAMLFAGYIGTKVGLQVLGKLPEKHFKSIFRWVLTLLALRVLWVWI